VLHTEKDGQSAALPSWTQLRQLPSLKMKDVHNYISPAIQQNNVSTNEHVCAIGRWRREAPLKVFGTRLQASLQPGRECAAPHQLFFQSRGQLLFFC
jgi:hypothetical protein